MKIWIDSKEAPKNYFWCKNVVEAIQVIHNYETMFRASGGKNYYKIEIISINYNDENFDHFLDWFKNRESSNFIPIHLHL